MEKRQYSTRGRARLIQYLSAPGRAPETVEQIVAGMAEGGRAPALSSVYRMLGELCACGEVRRHRLPAPDMTYVYQLVGRTHRCDSHFHLHCVGCGAVTHLDCACGEQIAAMLRREHGFCADCAGTVFYGMCAECVKRGRTV